MTQIFSELLQDVFNDLGHQITKGITATGGSTTAIVCTNLDESFQDDDFNNYIAFVHRSTDAAAPQNEFKKVTDYVASTFTLTTETFSAAIGAGDEILLVKPNPFPIEDVKRLCRLALHELGEMPSKDTSISFTDAVSYTLPTTIRKKPKQVLHYGDDGIYLNLDEWDVVPNTAGSNWSLYVPNPPSGDTALILYDGLHPDLMDYDDPIMDIIPRPLARAVCSWYIAEWHAKQDETWQKHAARLFQMYQTELIKFPLRKTKRKAQGMPHW